MRALMIKQKYQNTNNVSLLKRVFILVLVTIFSLGFILPNMVNATSLQEQINNLQTQNNQNRQKVQALQVEASSLSATISSLAAQISSLEKEIQANEDHKADLEKQIVAAEEELAKQKHLLGENIKAMYIEGQISTLEMLASSKDLSEFVDKQQYHNSVKDKIRDTLDKITTLKFQLKAQKEQVEQLIKEKQAIQDQIASQKATQDRLLGLNQSEQSATDQQIKDNYNKIIELKRQQAIENIRLFGGASGGQIGGGGYPWGYATCLYTGQVDGPCWNYDWQVGGSVWNFSTGGYGYRNCTDWVSYRIRSTGHYVPGGLGNAATWDDRAPSYGYAVSSTPREGAAAVSNSGYYGHVMYVEAVNGDGSIIISDYNRAGTGKYDMTTLSATNASNLSYVYF